MIVIAALVLVTACSSNGSIQKQITSKQAKVPAHTIHSGSNSNSNLTQASSLSTTGAGNSVITPKQEVSDGSGYGDGNWFGGYSPIDSQTENPTDGSVNPGQSSGSKDSSQSVQQVLDLVNQERKKAGLNPLSLDNNLSKMAMAKAQDMYDNNYFDHQSPTYGSPFDMMKAFGITYSSAGENIAKGQTSPEEVMNQWMNSPGHRANILNSSYTEIGIAYYNSEWVQEFTG